LEDVCIGSAEPGQKNGLEPAPEARQIAEKYG